MVQPVGHVAPPELVELVVEEVDDAEVDTVDDVVLDAEVEAADEVTEDEAVDEVSEAPPVLPLMEGEHAAKVAIAPPRIAARYMHRVITTPLPL